MIITRTPYPITLLGDGTDRPDWTVANGGIVIGLTVDRYLTVMAQRTPEWVQPNILSSSDVPFIREDMRHFAIDGHYDLTYHHGLPACGIDRYSVLEIGVANALTSLNGQSLCRDDLAYRTRQLRRNTERCGRTDRLLSSWGGLNVVRYHPGSPMTHTVYPLQARCHELQQRLLLVYLPNSLALTFLEPTKVNLQTVQLLTERGVEAVYDADWCKLGNLLDNIWKLERGTNPPGIERLYATSRLHGVIGGRLLKNNEGATLALLLVDPSHRDKVVQAMGDEAIPLNVHITGDGSRIVFQQQETR